MKKTTQLKVCLLFIFTNLTVCFAQLKESDWSKSSSQKIEDNSKKTFNSQLPSKYAVWDISISSFKNKLNKSNVAQEIQIPSPNGEFETFVVKSSKIVADEVAHLYTIKTFRGYKKDDPSTLIACDVSDGGFHAAVFTASESYFIEPIYKDSPEKVMLFYKKNSATSVFNCMTKTASSIVEKDVKTLNVAKSPTTKRTYRLAVLAAQNYAQQFGGNPYNEVNVLNALAAGVNMVSTIYLRDFGVEFTLVSDAGLIRNNNQTGGITNKINNVIGAGAYDVGHLVLWGGEDGLAGFKVVCGNDKGNGYSSSSLGVSTLWVDYVAHEAGHQFGSEHNQSGCNGVTNFRYEPGEGSSIMSYANVCQGAQQYAQNSDPFFHYGSITQIVAELPSYNCSTNSAAGNASDPVADAKVDFTIPKETPFVVVGSGADANDPLNGLTYNWAQYDGGGVEVFDSPECNQNNNALFRYRAATTDNYRSLPQYSDVLAGNNDQQWEKLPCTARAMNFSLTVRDNNVTFGRLHEDSTTITVANTGPFNVTSPNGGQTYTGSSNQTITWSVNNTDSHCANVDILLSIDGGSTYSVIANATANDGSESIIIPDTPTTNARILVRCDVAGGFRAASTFYDVSDADFSIQQSMSVDEFSQFNIDIFPNPASNELNINLRNDNSFSYKLFSVNGRLIYSDNINKTAAINTSNLAEGMYFLQISDLQTSKTAVKKIIVNH